MIVVSNAGPLIALAQIDQLDLLPAIYGRLHIPPAVFDEVAISGRHYPGAAEIRAAEWVRVHDICPDSR